jgi:hypothetical protein
MKKSLVSIIAVTVLLFGAVGYVGAITFGERDGNAHPHVGTLLFVQNGVGYFSCTGTLISPTTMLTAGHCTEEAGNPNNITYVRFDEDALEGIGDFASLQAWLDDRWILADGVIPHPNYDDFSEFPQTFDVGLVLLPSPGVMVGTYGMLPPNGILETVLAENGNSTNWWTAVGYGVQGVLNPFAMDDFARYNTIVRLIEINSSYTGPGSSAKFTNNPGRGRGGTCFGDSGGPIFYQDTPIIGAVVSFGITPCIGVDFQFRIDTATALDFIGDNLP